MDGAEKAQHSRPELQKQFRACVFAHYDRDGIVDEYVYHFLRDMLENVSQIELVTTASISKSDIDRLESMGIKVNLRCNEGYDFCSYKLGIEKLDLKNFQELILCNDSVYGPLFPFSATFNHFSEIDCDFWGISASKEIARHIQSYFMVFRRPVLEDHTFTGFWSRVSPLSSKDEVIKNYEVGLSQNLLAQGFSARALIDTGGNDSIARFFRSLPEYWRAARKKGVRLSFYKTLVRSILSGAGLHPNPLQYDWKAKLVKSKAPVFKIELLRDNPHGIFDREALLEAIETNSNYPVSLIRDHLNRTGLNRQ